MEEIPKNRLLDVWNPGKNGMNYQHQLVGRISSINSLGDLFQAAVDYITDFYIDAALTIWEWFQA